MQHSSFHQNQSTTSNPTHQQRRTFRGRGGATDRQLPKYNAARRRRPPPQQVEQIVVVQETSTTATTQPPDHDSILRNDDVVYDNSDDYDDMDLYKLEIIDPFVTQQESTENNNNNNNNENHNTVVVPLVIQQNATSTIRKANSASLYVSTSVIQTHDESSIEQQLYMQYPQQYTQEVQHLRQRIQKVRSSWSKSKVGIIIISNYQTNVLNASLNIFQEWNSIVRKYHSNSNSTSTTGTNHPNNTCVASSNANVTNHSSGTEQQQDMKLTIHNELFLLIQHSVQCGPLIGSQPGYFKRCGTLVAQMVYTYLQQILPDNDNPPEQHQQQCGASNATNDAHNHDVQQTIETDRIVDAVKVINSTTTVVDRCNPKDVDGMVPSGSYYCGTIAQMNMLNKWKHNAYKAAYSNNKKKNKHSNTAPPSTSMIQQEQKAQAIQMEKKRIKALKGIRNA
jgi:hypothetical protein